MSLFRTGMMAGAALLLSACSGSPAGLPSDGRPNTALGVPASAPSLVGVVASVEPRDRALLEYRPVRAECRRQALASLGSRTRLVHRDGTPASASDLKAGQRISAWFGSVELRSCPVQVEAVAIVIEP